MRRRDSHVPELMHSARVGTEQGSTAKKDKHSLQIGAWQEGWILLMSSPLPAQASVTVVVPHSHVEAEPRVSALPAENNKR